MNAAAVQLSFEANGLDPRELAQLSTMERGKVYDGLGLDRLQRMAAEEAVQAVLRREYAAKYGSKGKAS